MPVDDDDKRSMMPAARSDGDEASTRVDPIRWVLDRLEWHSRTLRRLTAYIVRPTLLNIIGASIAFFLGSYVRHLEYASNRVFYNGLFIGLYAPVVIGVLFALWMFEYRRRSADALFDELSDTVQRDLADHSKAVAEQSLDKRASIEERVLLREYRLTRNLPFTSGQGGPAVYLLANLLLLLVSLAVLFLGQ